jgi:glycosyltransferase involved in cell wall biosynthesis
LTVKVLLVGAPPGAPDGVQDYLGRLAEAMAGEPGLRAEAATMPALPSPGRLRELRRAAAACDVVHLQYPMEGWSHSPLPPVLAALLGGRRRRPLLVVTLHEHADLHPLRRLNVAPLLRRAAGVVVPSAMTAQRLRGAAARPPSAVIPVSSNIEAVPVDWERARRLRESWLGGPGGGPGTVVGFFGSLYRAKRPEALLDVVARLRERGARAVAVYAGSVNPDQAGLPRELAEEAARRGLPAPVFTGYLADPGEVRATLAAFDAAALMYHDGPSLRRGSMLACLEAGTRTVVPPGPGLAEVEATAWGPAALARRQLVIAAGAEGAADAVAERAWEPARYPPLQAGSWAAAAAAHAAFYRRLLAGTPR